ncbi:MAG: hypothetical protein KDK23_02325 [Leptospiraceae bacterium]|nr:hypothetical protein [Leptospiraceae bacterium]
MMPRPFFIFPLFFALFLTLFLLSAGRQRDLEAEEPIPSYFLLPQGSWEEKDGATKLKIHPNNFIQLSFIAESTTPPCQIEVYGFLRNEYTARPGHCSMLQYDRLTFAFEGPELILTLLNPGANYREITLVKEGSTQDAPEI